MFIRLITIAIFVISSQTAYSQPFCKNTLDSVINIYSFQGENYMVPLSNYYQGYNLTYIINSTQIYNVTINQPYSQKTNQININKIIDIAYANLPQNQVQYSLLEYNLSKYYNIYFTQDRFDNVPNFNTNDQVTLNTTGLDNLTCYGLTSININITAIDCANIKDNGKTIITQLYLVSPNQLQPNIIQSQIGGNQAKYYFSNRKTINFVNSNNEKYLIQFVPFTSAIITFPAISSYFEIYQYNLSQQLPDYPFGTLKYVQSIDNTNLNIQQALRIVDIYAINDVIFILDNNIGVIKFQLDNNQISNIQFKNNSQYELAWGFYVLELGFQYEMLVVTQEKIQEYYWGKDSLDAELIQTYDLEFTKISSIIKVGMNSNYIFISLGKLLDVYQRGQTQVQDISFSFTSVDNFWMLPINNILYLSYQKYFSNVKPQTVGIQLTSTNQSPMNQGFQISAVSNYMGQQTSCKMTFNSTVLPSEATSNLNIYFSGIQSAQTYTLPADWVTQFPLGISYIGPNIKYSANLSQPNVADIQYNIPESINITFDQIPTSQQPIIFVRSFVYNQNQFFLLQQTATDYITYIYPCEIKSDNPSKVECYFILISLGLGDQIQLFTQMYWNNYPLFIVALKNSLSQIRIYDFGAAPFINFNLPQNNTAMNLQSGNELIFILSNNTFTGQKQILIYTIDQQQKTLQLQVSINQELITKLTGQQSFSPLQFFISSKQQGLIFIQTISDVIILSFINEINYITNVKPQFPQGTSWQIQITNDCLLIAVAGQNSFIQEYSLSDLTNIILTKNYPLYGYQYLNPIIWMVSSDTSLMYVLANEVNLPNKTFLLIYKTNQPKVATLYATIQITDEVLDQTKPLSIFANGIQQDLIFIIFNQKTVTFRVPYQQSLFLSPYFPDISQDFIVNVGLNVSVQPWGQQQTAVELSCQITFINSQTKPTQNKQAIQQSGIMKLFQVNPNITNQSQSFIFDDYDWFYGSIPGYKIECNDCEESFLLHNHLEQIQEDAANISDVQDFFFDDTKNQTWVLTYYHIRKLQQNLKQVEIPIYLDVTPPDYCQKLLPFRQSPKDSYIKLFAICYSDEMNSYYVIPVNLQTEDPQASLPLYLPEIIHLGEVFFMDNLLVVLNVGEQSSKSGDTGEQTSGSIYIYKLNYANSYGAQIVQILNSQTLNTPLNITSFELVVIDANIYQFILLNQTQSLVLCQLTMPNYAIQYREFTNITDLLIQQNQYFPDNSYTIKIKVLQASLQNGQYIYNILIVSRWAASYEFELRVVNKNQYYVQLSKAFNSYGYNYPIPNILVQKDIFVIPYYNSSINTITFAYYNISKIQNNSQSNIQSTKNSIPFVHMIGGFIIQNVKNAYFPLQFYIDENNTTNLIYANPDILSNQLSTVHYNSNLTLEVFNYSFKDQNISFVVQSDYSYGDKIEIPIVFIQPYVPPPHPSPSDSIPSDDDNGLQWYWVLTIILGGVFVIGIIVIIIVKIQKNKNSNPNFREDQTKKFTQDDEDSHVSIYSAFENQKNPQKVAINNKPNDQVL